MRRIIYDIKSNDINDLVWVFLPWYSKTKPCKILIGSYRDCGRRIYGSEVPGYKQSDLEYEFWHNVRIIDYNWPCFSTDEEAIKHIKDVTEQLNNNITTKRLMKLYGIEE